MANIPLQSITFPGLSDKYTTPVVDNTLTQTGAAADAKKTGDEIGAIKNDLSDGTFIVNNAENAEQLTSTVGIEDTTPYLFRTSGGSNDIGDREDVRKIVGGTIVNNQLAKEINSTNWRAETNVTATFENGIGSFTSTTVNYGIKCSTGVPVQGGHIYFGCTTIKAVSECDVRCLFGGTGGAVFDMTATASFAQYAKVVKASSGATGSSVFVFPLSDTGLNVLIDVKDILFKDVTQEFGTTIADYVYSLEQATAGAGVAWLKKHFPKQFDSGYQAYDSGSMQSVSGLTEHRMTGFNQWDEVAEVGAYASNDGSKVTSNDRIRSKNFIPILPETTYYSSKEMQVYFYDANHNYIDWRNYGSAGTFVTLPKAYYMTFNCMVNSGTTYNHDICINLHWDGEKDGTYEPYKTWSYALDDSVTLRGIPKVDASGNLYYDGDEYLPDGTVNRRWGIVDLGTLTWSYNSAYGFYCSIPSYIKPTPNSDITNARCAKYVATTAGNVTSGNTNKSFAIGTAYVYVSDDAYTDAVTFKTAMSGVYLVYELDTPTTETAEPYQSTQIVDDFGTEEFVLADGAFPVPVGHNTMYQNNLRAKLEMSPDSPDGDGLYVVQQERGENTYVPLASTATIQDILTRLTALENA